MTALEETAIIVLGLFHVCNSGGNVVENVSKKYSTTHIKHCDITAYKQWWSSGRIFATSRVRAREKNSGMGTFSRFTYRYVTV